MAQTRRKRQTKHRGNAAGVVESRGRTGRKPTAAEKSGPVESGRTKDARRKKEDRPPTWRGASLRAFVAAVMMVAILLAFKLTKSGAAFALFPLVFVMYIPVSYYTDRYTYNRRQRSKAKGRGSKAAPR